MQAKVNEAFHLIYEAYESVTVLTMLPEEHYLTFQPALQLDRKHKELEEYTGLV